MILAARSPEAASQGSGRYDYEVLLLERSGAAKAFSETFVYPGGVVSDADSDARWRHVFSTAGTGVDGVARGLSNHANSPPVVRDDGPSSTHTIPKCVAMRITAIRETFEECGVLLLVNKDDARAQAKMHSSFHTTSPDLATWRKRVTSDPVQFLELCEALQAVPNVSALTDWSNWLTPVMRKVSAPPAKARRYDTIFFLCCMDHKPEVEVDGQELVSAQVSH